MCKPLSVRLCAHACLQPSLTETIHILWFNVYPTNYFQILSYNLIFWIFGSDISHLRNVSIHVYAYVGLHLYLYVSRLLVGNFVFLHVTVRLLCLDLDVYLGCMIWWCTYPISNNTRYFSKRPYFCSKAGYWTGALWDLWNWYYFNLTWCDIFDMAWCDIVRSICSKQKYTVLPWVCATFDSLYSSLQFANTLISNVIH